MKKLLALSILLCIWSSVSFAETAVYRSEWEISNAILSAVSSKQTEIKLDIKYSENQDPIKLFDNAVGRYGEQKYGTNFILKGVDSVWNDHHVENGILHLNYQVKYNYSELQEANLQDVIKKWTADNLTPDMSDTVKAALITKYIADNISYSPTRAYNNAVAAYQNKIANTTGYAELTSRMLTAANIPNKIVTGIIPGETAKWDKRIPVTTEFLRHYLFPAPSNPNPDYVTWNLVQIDGYWYHVNISKYKKYPWRQFNGHEEELFSSDEMFGLTDGWIRSEFPEAKKVLWYGDTEEKRFLKALFCTFLYDHPAPVSQSEFESYVHEALANGETKIQVISTVGGVGEATSINEANGRILETTVTNYKSVYCEYFIVTSLLHPTHPRTVYPLDNIPAFFRVQRGAELGEESIVNPTISSSEKPEIMILSRQKLQLKDGKILALANGPAFLAVINKESAKVVKVEISEPEIQLFLDGEILNSAKPVVRNGRSLVPLRALVEAMGAHVEYTPSTKVALITKGNQVIEMTMGDPVVLVNKKVYRLDAPADIIDGYTYVPVRFISENMDAKVIWDSLRNKIMITTHGVEQEN